MEISTDFQRIVQENVTFKEDICTELDGIRNLLTLHQISLQPNSVQNVQANISSVSLVVTPSIPDPPVISQPLTVVPQVSSDIQT